MECYAVFALFTSLDAAESFKNDIECEIEKMMYEEVCLYVRPVNMKHDQE